MLKLVILVLIFGVLWHIFLSVPTAYPIPADLPANSRDYMTPNDTAPTNVVHRLSVNDTKRRFITHIGFLKVHKAGSSTISNVLFRFGERHNLSFALPQTGNYLTQSDKVVQLRHNDKFDILAVHTKYSPRLYKSVLHDDAVKIAIIREPLDRMISAAYYYRDKFHVKYLEQVPRDTFIHDLINQPDKYETEPFSFTKNSMGKDFGFDENTSKEDDIRGYLEYLNKEFTVVLVMERFQESLVLMKRLFNWSLEDIIYLESNSNPHRQINFTEAERKKFQNTCFLDYAIYDHFSDIFSKKLETVGHDFQNEVKHFNEIVASVSQFCSSSDRNSNLDVPKSPWNEQFQLTMTECTRMKTSVLNYIDDLRRRHRVKQF